MGAYQDVCHILYAHAFFFVLSVGVCVVYETCETMYYQCQISVKRDLLAVSKET